MNAALYVVGALLVCAAAAIVYAPAGLALFGLALMRLSRAMSNEEGPPIE